MTTLAVYINKIEDIDWIDKIFQAESRTINNPVAKASEISYKKLKPILETFAYDRVYFGCEFCENLIPSHNDVYEVITHANSKGLNFTLVTPFVTNYGLDKVNSLLSFLETEKIKNVEVVFNDFGVYQLIKERYESFTPIAGRRIDKTPRDGRLTQRDYAEYFSKGGFDYIRRPNITAKSYQQLLCDMGVRRVDLDFLPQGFCFSKHEIITSLSLYIPFGFITSGRQCMMSMLDRNESEKFSLNGHCAKKCRFYAYTQFKRLGTILSEVDDARGAEVIVYGKGNTVFYHNDNIQDLSEELMGCFDRIVYQPVFST